jgi:hypothetical protein
MRHRIPLDDVKVRFVSEESYVRRDGGIGHLWRWAVTCAVCGEWFEIVQGTSHATAKLGPELHLGRLLGHMPRRCEACRPVRSV